MSNKPVKKSIAGTPKPSTTPAEQGAAPDPVDGPVRTRRVDWQWFIAGIVIFGVSLFLLIAQTANPTANTGLFSGPMGQALNIGGVVAGAWVIWKAFKG